MNLKFRWLLLSFVISSFAFAQSNFHNEWIDYSKTYYKFKVMGFGVDANNVPLRSGMVQIPFSTLVSAGLSNIASQHFQLWKDGSEVPVFVSTPSGLLNASDYIEFFGEINNGQLDKEMYRNPDFQLNDKWSLQTDTASYFLTVNTTSPNLRFLNAANNTAGNTLAAEPYFTYTTGRYFRNHSNGFYASLGQNLYSSSYDRGEGLVSRAVRPVGGGCGSTSLPQGFTSLYPYLQGPDMTIRINAVGDMQNSRKFRVDLNGDSISTYQMDYINYVKAEETVSVSKISSGTAGFSIVNQSPSLCDEMRVALVELTYPRIFNFDNKGILNFTVESSSTGRYLAISNFSHSNIAPVLYDLTNHKRYVADISNPDTVKIVLDPSVDAYNLVLTSQSGSYFKNITGLDTRTFINYSNIANQGDYLIISNPLIYGSGTTNYVEQYRQYRTSGEGGLYNAKIIDIDQLTDQFAWGIKKHPLSVRNFLRFAKQNFASAPRYVFIIGKGVVYNEYRANESNALAERLNLVPTWGNPASDNLLASANNVVAAPVIPIGRLSAVSAQEVGDYLNKVKQHDSAQRSQVYTIEGKGWMKNVLQIAGANDIGLGNQLDTYLDNYKQIISDTSFGANVHDYSKTADPGGYTAAIGRFKSDYENGASLITYFGHSSATSLDFNLDNPANYNNKCKYPVFIANGCSAGNHFNFEANRINATSTISEKFIFAPQRGAIGYLASTHYGVINYLDTYTKDFYKAIGRTKYNQPIGDVIKEAISSTLAVTGINDYYSRVHSEQYALHGDPAVKLNSSAKADYVIEEPQIQINPSFVSVADSTFSVKVKVHNIGRATSDSVTLKIQRETPGGDVFTVLTKTFAKINLLDSITVEVPVVSNRDKGINKITAIADFGNGADELSETNNTAVKQFEISEEEIRPVYPYKYAVITQPNVKLTASTVNPLNDLQVYVMELDTTALFNSISKISVSQISVGGVVEFDPGISFQNGLTYYWRVAPSVAVQPHWVNASFVYKAGSLPGFQQGHLYQDLQSQLTRISLDSTSGLYSFQNKLHNLFITNSIYPTSGTEDGHFSISVDGSTIIQSACVGSSVIFNVFDSLTFLPKLNTNRPFGAAAVCGAFREYNFEYQYRTAATRKNAMDFIDAIPAGSYVSVRLILDQPYNSYAANWAADTSLYGHNNSLYHRLKQYGFTAIDSFNSARTWAFIFRKGDVSFTPSFALSKGLYDRINLSANCVTSNTQGYIASPVFGPAKQWNNINWTGYSKEQGNDVTAVNVYGIKSDKSATLLYTLDSATHSLDISSVSAAQYPFIKLEMNTADTVTATPYQLQNWNIGYVPVPEGAIAPNLYLNIPDTVTMFSNPGPNGSQLHVGFAFKNVSKADFTQLGLKVILTDSLNNTITYPMNKMRSLIAGDSLHVDVDLDVSYLQGRYNLFVEVNPDNDQPEQYRFNNFLYKYVFIDNGRTLPVGLVDFKAVAEGSKVKTLWSVSNEANAKEYEIEHSSNLYEFNRLGSVKASANESYFLYHTNPSKGKNYYRLKLLRNDGSFIYSATRVVDFNPQISISIYPNPAKDVLNIAIADGADKVHAATIFDAFGRKVKQVNISGRTSIGTSSWAAGVYMIQIDNGGELKTFKVQKQ